MRLHGDLSDISGIQHRSRGWQFDRDQQRPARSANNPVHLAVDPTNRFIVVANHLSSSVVLLARNPGWVSGRAGGTKSP